MISVVDYGAGNLRSVVNALNALGVKNELVSSEEGIMRAKALIIPGVGAFGAAMSFMNERGVAEAIIRRAEENTPILGICLGLQLLFEGSEETPDARGLGVFAGRVTRLKTRELPVPHIGWTSVENLNSKLLDGRDGGFCFYCHSYAVSADSTYVSATSEYGEKYAAIVERGNVFGCQFHPEKSGKAGLYVLSRFAEIAEGV